MAATIMEKESTAPLFFVDDDGSTDAAIQAIANNVVDEPPTLAEAKRLIPTKSFHVDTATSLLYFSADLLAVGASMGFLNAVVHSDFYNQMSMPIQALMVAPLQVLMGFAMWCMWCIGEYMNIAFLSCHTL
jgi:omega-3 fatty acid desaturase (delta-15 desaturase)